LPDLERYVIRGNELNRLIERLRDRLGNLSGARFLASGAVELSQVADLQGQTSLDVVFETFQLVAIRPAEAGSLFVELCFLLGDLRPLALQRFLAPAQIVLLRQKLRHPFLKLGQELIGLSVAIAQSFSGPL